MNRIALVVTVLSALVLSGCTTPPPAAGPTPEAPVATATPTATPVIELAPQSLIDVDCDDFATEAELSGFVGDKVTTQPNESERYGITDAAELAQLGGFRCDWTNGIEDTGEVTGPQDRGVSLRVLPKAGKKWDRYAEAYSIKGDTHLYCYDYEKADTSFFCGYFAHINDVWIELYLDGADKPGVVGDKAVRKSLQPMIDKIDATLAGATYVAEPWEVPATAAPVPEKCKSIVKAAQVRAATGVTGKLVSEFRTDGPQVDMTIALDGSYLTKSCSFAEPNSDNAIGGLAVLPGGAWVWDDVALSPDVYTPVDVAGLHGDERATLDCYDPEEACSIHLLVAGNWIVVRLYPSQTEMPEYALGVEPRDALVTIATDLVANLLELQQ